MPMTEIELLHGQSKRRSGNITRQSREISDRNDVRRALTHYEILRFWAASLMQVGNADLAVDVLECVAMEARRARRSRISDADFDHELFEETRNDAVVYEIILGYEF